MVVARFYVCVDAIYISSEFDRGIREISFAGSDLAIERFEVAVYLIDGKVGDREANPGVALVYRP